MPRTLYARLSLALVGLLLVVGVAFALLTLAATRSHLQEVHQRLNRDLAQNLVSDRELVRQGRLDRAALKETFHHYMVVNPSIEIYLLDAGGLIQAYSAEPGQVKRRRVDLRPVRRFLDGEPRLPLLGDDPRSHDRRKAFSVTPIPDTGAPEGYLYVILRGERFDELDTLIQQSYFLRLSGAAAGISLVLGLVLGLVLFRVLTRRVERLGRAMERFRASDFSSALESPGVRSAGGDEIDRLGRTFEAMAGRIRDQIQSLSEQDRLRRELVAQVSHDLRTPLASLHGYLETLRMKATDLRDAERIEYLNVALRHSRHLRRLVDDLFDLARLEAREIRPEIEPVSLGDLAQDLVQKYRLGAERKGIRLELQGEGTLPLVGADTGLVERVLANLIDNAIRHTPAAGTIRVGTRLRGRSVEVGVSDTGRGIPAEVLPRIFDRSFRADVNRGAGRHAGLGLAIARRIVELHDSHIEVISRVGEGTAFSFSLPVWHPAD